MGGLKCIYGAFRPIYIFLISLCKVCVNIDLSLYFSLPLIDKEKEFTIYINEVLKKVFLNVGPR